MTSLLLPWSRDDVSGFLCSFLSCEQLAQLEVADSRARDLVSSGTSWDLCISQELRGIHLRGDLSGSKIPMGGPERWKELKGLAFRFLRTSVLDANPVVLTEWGPARELGAAMRRAQQTAAAHSAKTGGLSLAFIGRFYFPSEATAPGNEAPDVMESHPMTFKLGSDELALSMGLKGATACFKLSGNTRADGARQAGSQALLADFWSQGRVPLLRTRGLQLTWPGTWVNTSGLCSIEAPMAEFENSLHAGVLCVVCIRHGEAGASAQVSSTIHALQFDKPRAR